MRRKKTLAETIQKLRDQNKELKAENERLRSTLELHAGDVCSLNNEVEQFRVENDELKEVVANAAEEDYYGCYEIIQEYVNK